MKVFARVSVANATLTLSLALAGCAGLEERPIHAGVATRSITLERSYSARAECTAATRTQVAAGWYAEACAYYRANPCVIKMEPDASDATLGHEVRHCFDGPWHR